MGSHRYKAKTTCLRVYALICITINTYRYVYMYIHLYVSTFINARIHMHAHIYISLCKIQETYIILSNDTILRTNIYMYTCVH